MALQCPICGSTIPAENINMQKTLALCSPCNHIFDFSENALTRKKKRRDVRPPERLHIVEDDDQLELSHRFVLGPGPKFGFLMFSIPKTAR